MEKETLRNYLNFIRNVIKENVNACEITEEEGVPSLVCTFDSPFEGRGDIVLSIGIDPEEDDKGYLRTDIMTQLMDNIPSDKADEINELINYIRPSHSVGSFRLYGENNTLFLNQSFLIDKNMDMAAITKMIGNTITILEFLIQNAGAYFDRLLKGESLESLKKDFYEEEVG